MADSVLLVFEGAKTEKQVLDNLRKHHFKDQHSIIHATFDTDIYTLWQIVKEDEFLDLVEIIRERNAQNQADLQGILRGDISQIFLFFDYDGHATNASDETIAQMLAHFTDETDNGKLYISYPMVEALKHSEKDVDFNGVVVNAKDKIACHSRQLNYKQLIDQVSCHQDLRKLTQQDWQAIILKNYQKAHWIVNGVRANPHYHEACDLDQATIFDHQLDKFIRPAQTVAVLSAFPFFIIEYFGEARFNELV